MKNAYVTTLCHGDGYLPGVEALGKSLDASGTTVPKVVMVTPDVSGKAHDWLEKHGWEVRKVDPIENPASRRKLLFPRFARVFTKLRAWDLRGLDRVVLLDADTIVVRNVDDLFERRTFAAAPDFFMPDHFNSGVMLLEPSTPVFSRMLDAIGTMETYDGGDQGFLNRFFSDWYAMPIEHRLPVGYNTAHFIYQFMRGHPGAKARLENSVKIVHYMLQKPWQARSTLTGGSAAWWRCYHAAHPEEARAWKGRAHELEDWTFGRLASLVLD